MVYPRWLEDCLPFTNDFEIMTVEQYPVVHVLEVVDEAVSIVQDDAPDLLWTMYLGRRRVYQVRLAVQVERV